LEDAIFEEENLEFWKCLVFTKKKKRKKKEFLGKK
jgi:hypothetical protein